MLDLRLFFKSFLTDGRRISAFVTLEEAFELLICCFALEWISRQYFIFEILLLILVCKNWIFEQMMIIKAGVWLRILTGRDVFLLVTGPHLKL